MVTDVIYENHFHNSVYYMNLRNPFQFQCEKKESRQIMNVETELNNTVNKTHLIQCFYSQLLGYNKLSNCEEQGEGHILRKIYNKNSNAWHIVVKQRSTWNVYCSHDRIKPYYLIGYSLCVHWPKAVGMQ